MLSIVCDEVNDTGTKAWQVLVAVTANTRRTIITADRLWDPMIVLLVPPSVDTYNCRKTEGRKRPRRYRYMRITMPVPSVGWLTSLTIDEYELVHVEYAGAAAAAD